MCETVILFNNADLGGLFLVPVSVITGVLAWLLVTESQSNRYFIGICGLYGTFRVLPRSVRVALCLARLLRFAACSYNCRSSF